jgi:cephalosporin hydroxylase
MRYGASQDEDELALAISLVQSIKPKVIVELGCDRGGTLFAWRNICAQVYGITWDENADSGGAVCATYGAAVHGGDTHDPESLKWLLDRLASGQGWNPVDVLVVDGDHHLDGIIRDLQMYGPLVRPGGLIMLHDRVPVRFPEVETWKIWPRLREMYQTTEIGDVFGWGVIHVREGDDFIRVRAGE